MKYLFECTNLDCLNKEDKEILMVDYDKEKYNQKCSKCGCKMVRIVENCSGVKLCSGMYGIDSGKGWTN